MDQSNHAYQTLVPELPKSRRLVKRKCRGANGGGLKTVFEIEGTMSRFFARPVIAVSERMFSVLEASDGKKTLGELLEQDRLEENRRTELVHELLELWAQRFIILRPKRG